MLSRISGGPIERYCELLDLTDEEFIESLRSGDQAVTAVWCADLSSEDVVSLVKVIRKEPSETSQLS
jgi:hypothetical protein